MTPFLPRTFRPSGTAGPIDASRSSLLRRALAGARRRAPRRLIALAAAAVTLTVASGCARIRPEEQRPETQPAATYAAQFDTLWSRFARVYPSFEYKGMDWQSQGATYRPRALRARSQNEFIAVAREMLEPLRDLHVWFVDPRGEIVPTYRPSRMLNFDRVRWERAMRANGYVQRANGLGDATIAAQWASSLGETTSLGYGYLFLGTWKAPVDAAMLDLSLQRMKDVPGLIIDVRTNAGGIDATALAFVSRFTPRTFAASYVQTRSGPSFSDLEVPVARNVSARGPWQYTRPVVIITGRGGLSATESFVAAMRTLPNVTVIGDTTGGASGNPATYPLGNGWQFTVPRWIEYTPDKKPIEGRGVPPHLTIAWTPALYDSDRDPLIDAAVGLLAERSGAFRIAPLEIDRGRDGASDRAAPANRNGIRNGDRGSDRRNEDAIERNRLQDR